MKRRSRIRRVGGEAGLWARRELGVGRTEVMESSFKATGGAGGSGGSKILIS